MTHELKWFLAKWAKMMSWKEVASAFRVSWDCTKQLQFICSDMWQGYLKVIHKKAFRSKRELILNWFRAGGTLSSGSVEGFNNKVKLVTRKSYGFKTQEAYEIALYHNLGDLPQLEFTHRFF